MMARHGHSSPSPISLYGDQRMRMRMRPGSRVWIDGLSGLNRTEPMPIWVRKREWVLDPIYPTSIDPPGSKVAPVFDRLTPIYIWLASPED